MLNKKLEFASKEYSCNFDLESVNLDAGVGLYVLPPFFFA